MAEVSIRGAQQHALSDDVKKGKSSFNVRSWEGLTEMLQAGRKANMDSDSYANFRDMVLEYARSGGTDATLRSKIESITGSFGNTQSDATIKTEESIPQNNQTKVTIRSSEKSSVQVSGNTVSNPSGTRFGITRPVPNFGVRVVEKKKVVPGDSSSEASRRVSVPDSVSEIRITPQVPHEMDSHKQTYVKKERAVVAEKTRGASEGIETSTKTPEEYRARIAAIKQIVNARVGNPVTLVGRGNTVGREYMSALIAAMKAVGGSAPGTLVSSMSALEDVFKRVMELPQKEEKQQDAPSAAEPTKPSVAKDVGTSSADTAAPPTPEVEIATQYTSEEPEHIEENISVPVSKKTSTFAIPSLADESKEVLQKEVEAPTVVLKEEEKMPIATPAVVVSESEQTQVPDVVISQLPIDELNTPEVTSGLKQLLDEWQLFRGSGVFGTGPGGHEHPLYKRLSPLPMSMIAVGSWDGAQKDAVLSIRDYMNGWRQEQGISYIPEESFDHYLRRVVQKVLKRGR